MPGKFTKNSKPLKTLVSWLQSGKLSGNENARDVQASSQLFSPYKLTTFRTRWNALRKEYGKQSEESGEDEEDLNRKCSDVRSPSRKRRFFDAIEAKVESDAVCEEVDGNDDVSEAPFGSGIFRPLYLLSEWSEPETTTRRITVAIVLPSGIDTGSFSIRVVEDGKCLLLAVQWPDPLINLKMMHKKWLSQATGFEMYHPKVSGFEASLKRLRKRTFDYIESSAQIVLPFPVQSHILSKHNLGWRGNGTRMVNVDLRASVEQYAVVNDENEFEIM